jgi:hypothetical protein
MADMPMEMVEVASLMDVFGTRSYRNFRGRESVERVEGESSVICA